MASSRKPRRWWRWLWLLPVAALTAGMLWWQGQQTPLMRLTARVPVSVGGFVTDGVNNTPESLDSDGLFVRLQPVKVHPDSTSIALLNWDGHPRWQVTVPVRYPPNPPSPWVNLFIAGSHAPFMPGSAHPSVTLTAGVLYLSYYSPLYSASQLMCGYYPSGSITHYQQSMVRISPDGHLLAIAFLKDRNIHVASWRDGRHLADAAFTLQSESAMSQEFGEGYLTMQVENSGRVWLQVGGRRSVWLWAIDGTHLAAGSYTFNGKGMYNPLRLSPDATGLMGSAYVPNVLVIPTTVGNTPGKQPSLLEPSSPTFTSNIDYATVQVQGERITVTPRYQQSNAEDMFGWCGDGLLLGNGGTLLGSKGIVHNADGWQFATNLRQPWLKNDCPSLVQSQTLPNGMRNYRVFVPPPGRPWPLHPRTVDAIGQSTPDGRVAVLLEAGKRHLSHTEDLLLRLPFLDRLFPRTLPARLVVYIRPGRRTAMLPLTTVTNAAGDSDYYLPIDGTRAYIYRCALSPDGRHLAVPVSYGNGKHEVLVYSWP